MKESDFSVMGTGKKDPNPDLDILNFSFYYFVDLTNVDLAGLREDLKAKAINKGIKGTILLAPEGLNGFLAARATTLWDFFNEDLNKVSHWAGKLIPKESWSDSVPFKKMMIKLKKEIITMGMPDIQPAKMTGPRLMPKELKQWYEEGKEMLVIDTRNDYEVRLGTFKNAVTFDMKSFKEFPEYLRSLGDEWKKKPVVTFCTGGIRCEKASALAKIYGFEEAYQLEGGILKYFEETGGDFWDGECFVFDQRLSLDPALHASELTQCIHCREAITWDECEIGVHHCYRKETAIQLNEKMRNHRHLVGK
jgi:UPF0176 protein